MSALRLDPAPTLATIHQHVADSHGGEEYDAAQPAQALLTWHAEVAHGDGTSVHAHPDRWWNVNEEGVAYDNHPTEAAALLVQAEYPNDVVVQASSAEEAEALALHYLAAEQAPEAPMTREEYLALAQAQVALVAQVQANVALLDAYEAEHPDEPRHDAEEALASNPAS